MMRMTDKQAERWARTRQKGRSHFIWFRGVLCWGVSVAIFWTCAMGALQGWNLIFLYLPMALILFPIGGYLWGAWMWRLCERQFEQSTQAGS